MGCRSRLINGRKTTAALAAEIELPRSDRQAFQKTPPPEDCHKSPACQRFRRFLRSFLNFLSQCTHVHSPSFASLSSRASLSS